MSAAAPGYEDRSPARGAVAVLPVCPACRAPIAIDAVWCGRCGLAVRPTCPVCAEPLSAGFDTCGACGTPIGPYGSEEPATPVAQPVADVRAARPRAPSAGREWLHVVGVALAAGVVVAGGLLALELVAPQRGLQEEELVERSLPALGFSVSHPAGWTVENRRFGDLDGADFDGGPGRGFRVILDAVAFEELPDELEAVFERERSGYRKLSVNEGLSLGGRPAVRHVYVDGSLVFEQWWVGREGGTYRIEFWAPLEARDAADAQNQRILETFRLT